MTKTPYEYCAIVEKKSYVIKIDINVFNSFLKKNIMKTMENIKELIKTRIIKNNNITSKKNINAFSNN